MARLLAKFKTAGKLSFLELFDAGHSVSAYQPVNQSVIQQVFHSTHNFAKRTVHTVIVVDDFIGSFNRRAIT